MTKTPFMHQDKKEAANREKKRMALRAMKKKQAATKDKIIEKKTDLWQFECIDSSHSTNRTMNE